MSIRSFALNMTALSILAMTSLLMPQLASAADVAAPRRLRSSTSVILTIYDASTISYGEDVDGYATVTSSDGTRTVGNGDVLRRQRRTICTIPVTQTSSCPPDAGTGFAAGTHMLTAVYSGDASHLGSTSNGVPIVVLPDVTTISLTSSANPASYGQSIAVYGIGRGRPCNSFGTDPAS